MHKPALIAPAVVLLVAGSVFAVAHAASPDAATCTDEPGVAVTCVLPYPAAQTVTAPGPTVTATATITATVTASPSSTPTVTPTPTPTVTPTPTTPPVTGGFPTETTTGLPAGWTPTQTINGSYTVSTAGAVVQDIRVNGDLNVNAANVTLRRVDVVGGRINNWPGARCNNGLKVYDSRISVGRNTASGEAAVGSGGYTVDNVLVVNSTEGFRDGGKSGGCGAVTILNSFAHIQPPIVCGDWHGDALQGYDGAAVTVKNTVLWLDEGSCGGTAPFFVPSGQGNTRADIDGLIVRGGGYPFRLGMPATVRNLHVVNGSWGYGPIDVKCSAVTSWSASISTLDSAGQPAVVRAQPCNSNGGT